MKTRVIKSVFGAITITLGMFSSTLSYSQHDHGSHSNSENTMEKHPPHHGQVASAGKYMVEMVFNELNVKEQLNFYILTKNYKILENSGINGKVTLFFEDGSSNTINLTPKGTDGFAADLSKPYPNKCHVDFLVNNKSYSADFSIRSSVGNMTTHAAYTCSMHPEIKSDKPGSCPKCGMKLVKKE